MGAYMSSKKIVQKIMVVHFNGNPPLGMSLEPRSHVAEGQVINDELVHITRFDDTFLRIDYSPKDTTRKMYSEFVPLATVSKILFSEEMN
jgi:hypothetical protein